MNYIRKPNDLSLKVKIFVHFFNAYVYYLNGEIDLTSGETGNCTR